MAETEATRLWRPCARLTWRAEDAPSTLVALCGDFTRCGAAALRSLLVSLDAARATLALLADDVEVAERALAATGLRHLVWRLLRHEPQPIAAVARLARGFRRVLFVGAAAALPPHELIERGSTWSLDAEGTRLVGWPVAPLDDEALADVQFLFPPPAAPRFVPHAALALAMDPTQAWGVVAVVQTAAALPTPRFSEPPPREPGAVRFVCVSDTHARTPAALPEGDVLLHAGDFSMTGKPEELQAFLDWFSSQPHRRKIVIAGNLHPSEGFAQHLRARHTRVGNHDLTLDETSYGKTYSRFHRTKYDTKSCRALFDKAAGVEYLCDSGTLVDGVTVWGSPWQPEFCGWAFNLPRGEPIRKRWQQIPTGTDVVVTHGPALGHGDLCASGLRAGCVDLLDELQTRVRPRFHVCGHIHEGYGVTTDGRTTFLNASTCDLRYKPENKPLVFDVAPKDLSASG